MGTYEQWLLGSPVKSDAFKIALLRATDYDIKHALICLPDTGNIYRKKALERELKSRKQSLTEGW